MSYNPDANWNCSNDVARWYRLQKAEADVARLRAELDAWRETFEEQTLEQRSHRSYAECYAIGTRSLLQTNSTPRGSDE